MCRVFVLLCSLHSSVLCGLPLDMCDIWSVVYTRRTYYISFHIPLIAQYSSIALRCTKCKQIPLQNSRFICCKIHDFGIRTDVFDVWTVFHARQILYMLFLIPFITPYYIIAHLLRNSWVCQINKSFVLLGACWVCNESSFHVYQ